MSTIKCPNCGNSVPEGSAFCNKCGSRIDLDFDDMNDWNSRPSKLSQHSYKKSRNSNITLYIVIALGIAAFATLFILTRCGNDKNNVQTLNTVDESSSAQADTLMRALNEYNYVGDGARIVYASRVTGSKPGVNDVIVGITHGNTFYKIYKLVKTSGKWTIDSENIKMISTAGYNVTFDQDKLKAGRDIIPQVVDIDGKKYFFYAFMKNPENDPSTAQVVMNMYDVETRAITTATYEGSFQNVNGEQVIVCNPASGSSKVVGWMNETARNFIRIISFKGEMQEEQQPEPEEVKPEPVVPDSTAQEKKETAVIETQDKETPMFNINDISKTVNNPNYKVMMLKDGSVISFNKSNGQNSKIHSGGAKDIGFYDVANSIISIRNNDDTRKRVDLKTGKIVNVGENPQPAPEKKEEKKEDTKKEETKKEEAKKEG